MNLIPRHEGFLLFPMHKSFTPEAIHFSCLVLKALDFDAICVDKAT